MRVFAFALVFVAGCSCGPRELVFVSSSICPPSGTIELWCESGGTRCEYRVNPGGPRLSCETQGSAECANAETTARSLCAMVMLDAGMDTSVIPDVPGAPDVPVAPDVPSDVPPDAPAIPCTGDTVDVLIMVDNSNSMNEEQALLRRELPRITRALSAYSLHVGVVTSDLGAGAVPAGESVPSCDPGFGDDGILRNASRGGPGCLASYPSRVFSFDPGDDADAFAVDIGCVSDLGTGGCGFEQQLEVMLKALSPAVPTPFVSSSYVAPTFVLGTTGHGDGDNAGFLRAGSVLALIPVTDEEDCSVPDYSLFYPNDPVYLGQPLNLRCSRFESTAAYPVSRFVSGFLQLRDDPSDLVFAPIVGIPMDLVGRPYDEVLLDPRLINTEDPSGMPPMRLLPSCATADGNAFPPRRFLRVAQGLEAGGARTTMQSICASSFTSAIDAILLEITGALSSCP